MLAQDLERYEYSFGKLGTVCRVVFYAKDTATSQQAIRYVLSKIDTLNHVLSDYDENSEIRKVCDLLVVNEPIILSKTLYDIIGKSICFSKLTNGAFDITVGNYVLLWRRARRQKVFPTPAQLRQAKATVGYQKIKLLAEKQVVVFKKKGMRLDVGAIGKGYIADAVLTSLKTEFGITVALVDLGGDISLGEAPPSKAGWTIQVKNQTLTLANCAIATSGDSFQYVEFGGKRYSHIINPRTGIGLTDAPEVTVIAPDGATADALASAMSVLGARKGERLMQRLRKKLGHLEVIFQKK